MEINKIKFVDSIINKFTEKCKEMEIIVSNQIIECKRNFIAEIYNELMDTKNTTKL